MHSRYCCFCLWIGLGCWSNNLSCLIKMNFIIFMLDTQALSFHTHFRCDTKIGVAVKVSLKLSANVTRQNELGGQWDRVQHVGPWWLEHGRGGAWLIFIFLTVGGGGMEGCIFYGNRTRVQSPFLLSGLFFFFSTFKPSSLDCLCLKQDIKCRATLMYLESRENRVLFKNSQK